MQPLQKNLSCKGFLKNIQRPNPVTVVEMNILPPKTHDTVKCRFVLPEGGLSAFLLTPSPSFSELHMNSTGFKMTPRVCWSDFLCAFIHVRYFCSYPSKQQELQGFSGVPVWFGMWNVWLCPITDPMIDITCMNFGCFYNQSCHPASLVPCHCRRPTLNVKQFVPPVFSSPLQS